MLMDIKIIDPKPMTEYPIVNSKKRADKMNLTKNAIIDSFWQLLEEKPYNKITVKDIVDRCQINRNTFYYHFHDIPDLLEYTIKQDTDSILEKYTKFGSLIDCLIPFVQHSLNHKKAILHIYRSIQREIFVEQLEHIALYVAAQYIDTVTQTLTLPLEDKQLLSRFYKCTLVGIVLDWLDTGMNYDLSSAAIRICELLDGSGRQAFLKSAKSVTHHND